MNVYSEVLSVFDYEDFTEYREQHNFSWHNDYTLDYLKNLEKFNLDFVILITWSRAVGEQNNSYIGYNITLYSDNGYLKFTFTKYTTIYLEYYQRINNHQEYGTFELRGNAQLDKGYNMGELRKILRKLKL